MGHIHNAVKLSRTSFPKLGKISNGSNTMGLSKLSTNASKCLEGGSRRCPVISEVRGITEGIA